jgi:homocysteine S-methyltransferase
MESFRDFLKKRIVLFDGAMGTYVYQKGVFIDKCFDELNLSNPDLIRGIHAEYVKAGCHVLETNTFGANRIKLGRHHLSEKIRTVNLEGVRLAREAAQGKAFVAGSMGPLGVEPEPWGEITREDAQDAFREQAAALAEGGVDVFILETFQDVSEVDQAVQAVRSICDIPVIAQVTVMEDGTTPFGLDVEEFTEQLAQTGADAVGVNCTCGPKPMLDFLERMVKVTALPLSVMPNAGRPQFVDGRTFYMSTPDYFCVYAKRFIEAGAKIIGGCCGTTPAHILKMAEALSQKETRVQRSVLISGPVLSEVVLPPPVPREKKSLVASKLAGGEFVTMVEMVPPKGMDPSKQLQGAEKLKSSGVDAINIPDGPRASARMNGLALALLLQERVGIEAVLHYTCRDRNLLGIQSDLLGDAVLGIKNILAITGDPPMMGDYPQATAVFDIDSIGLVKMLHNLNRGLDVGNKLIGAPTGFLIGVGLDPSSVNPDRERKRFWQKIESGAEFAVTQPVFNVDRLRSFLDQIHPCPIPIVAGVWPLLSLRNAEFMKNEVPGVSVPDWILETMGRYTSKEDQQKAGIEIARGMAGQVRSLVQGIQVSAPFGRVDVALDVCKA